MTVATGHIEVATPGRGFVDVTTKLSAWVDAQSTQAGILSVFIRHTSASLLISENADPDVRRDLERFFTDLVPDGDPRYQHVAEGPDDMSAHVRAALTHSSLSIPVRDGALALGTWQGVYLWEHRHRAHHRRLELTLVA